MRCDQLDALLLNEFSKAHTRMEQQESIAICEQRQIQALEARLDRPAAEIKKVSEKIAPNTTLRRTAPNHPHDGLGVRTADSRAVPRFHSAYPIYKYQFVILCEVLG